MLEYLLARLHAMPPDGVLVPEKKKHGRPFEEATRRAHELWVQAKRPVLSAKILDVFVKVLYPETFHVAMADSDERKKLRDRIRAAILRHDSKLLATKRQAIS
jgi:hypothetical protein